MYGGAVVVVVTLRHVTWLWHISCLSTGWPSLALVHSLQFVVSTCWAGTGFHPLHSLSFCHSSCFSGGLFDALLVLHTDNWWRYVSKSLKVCKGNHVPPQLNHPSQRMGLWNLPVGHPFQSADDSQRMSQVTFKAMGSERFNWKVPRFWRRVINICKTTYCAGWGQRSMLLHCWGRGAPVLSSVPGIVTSPSHV